MAQTKKVMMLVGLLFLIVSILPLVNPAGGTTQQSSKIFLNPFYKESFTAGGSANYTLYVSPPDKISSVINAIISFNAQINGQTQNFTLLVNGQKCNPASYMVATAFSTTGNIQFYYDCSNIITKAGNYTVNLKTAVATGAITGWLDLTYINNPSSIVLHGTEYNTGDPGKVWLQLLDSSKTPIDNATCFMTMYTPNNLQLYSYLQMTHLINGVYYFDFFAPEAVGVYPVIADCYYVTNSKMYYPNSYSMLTGTVISGDISSTLSNDGNRLKISEQTVSGPGLDFNMTFTNVTDISSETDFVIGLHGRWSGRDTDPVYIQIWNYTSSSWITTSNVIPTNVFVISAGSNATSQGLISNGNVTLRFVDANITDTDLEQLQIDSLWINIVAQGSTGTWEQVKGSSEVHVNSNGGHMYTWNTLCDDHNPSCAIFSSSDTLTEGVINETLTVNNIYRASLQDTITYETALGLDCTGVLSIIETYDDGRTVDVTSSTIYDIGTQQNCKMSIPVTFESTDSNMNIKITSDNYPKWEVEWAKNVVDGMTPTIENYCNNIASEEGFTYNLPISTIIDSTSGLSPEATYCYRAMDDLWYFENNYQLSQSVNTIGEYLSYLSESRFYYPLIYDHYNRFKQSINPITAVIKVAGTDYQIGDNGKIFLQLLQSNNQPINNASCFATVFYPNGTLWQNMAGMTYQTGSSGLYYFNFVAPSTTGVYMVDTICSYASSTVSTNASVYVIGKGWYMSGAGSSLTAIDNNFLNISEKNFNPGYVNTTVSTLLMGHLDEGNGTTTEDSSANPTTGTHIASPTLGIPGVSGAGVYYPVGSIYTNYAQVSKFNLNTTEAYMVCFSFNQSTTNANGNRLVDSLGATGEGFRFSFDNGNGIRFVSDRSGTGAQTLNSGTTYLDSTWHTYCGFANFTTQTAYVDGVQLVTQNVVQSGTMNLANGISLASLSTGGNYANVALDEVCYMKGTFGTGQSDATLASAYNTNKQCGISNSSMDMNITIPNVSPVDVTTTNPVTYTISSTYLWNGVTPDNVITQIYNYTGNTWLNLPTNLTLANTTATITNTFSGNLSNFLTGGNMTIRYYTLPNPTVPNMFKIDQVRLDQTNNVQLPQPLNGPRGSGELNIRNYSFDLIPIMPRLVWTYQNRNLTTDGNNLIAQTVWNYASRNLTYFDYVSQALFVWNSTSRNLTYFDYLTQAGVVWNYSMRNLTYFDFVTQGLVVWNTTNRNLTYFDFATQAGVVWNYTNRNLTYTPDMTNYLLISQMVWNNTNRNLTYFDFVTQATNVWNYSIRNLTFYPTQVDLTNYTLIGQTVWNYQYRNLTYMDFATIAQTVWNNTNRNLTYFDFSTQALTVWNYATRNLTYTPDVMNYLLAAQTVWNNTDRNLTYFDFVTAAVNVWNSTTRNLTYTQDVTNYILINQGVWNYPSRNLTYFPVMQVDLNAIATSVWNATTRNLTYYQDVTNYNLIAQTVWNYVARNLTYIPDLTNYVQIQTMVWNATTRDLTYYQDFTNNSLTAETVWNYLSRNLTYTSDATNYNTIQLVVWNATTRNLTYYQPTDLSQVPASVWNFTERNLTYTSDVTDYNKIFVGVWNYTTRNLTYYDLGNNLAASDVWNYVSRNLTFIPTVNATVDYITIANTVWNNSVRNLTFYPAQVDMTNYGLISQVVWNFTNRNLTYYNLGNNLAASDVWNYVSRNLTYYQDIVNYTAITENIWSYNNRTLTYYQVNNISTYDIWNFVNRSLTENISQEVWMYYNRTLTSFEFDNDSVTVFADAIWNYTNRSLTQDLPFEIWTYASRNLTQNISLDVWTYYNKTLNYYPDVTNYSLIWTQTNRSLTYYADATNYTLLADSVWGYTGTINSNILSQFAYAIWNYVGSISIINNQIANAVWQFPARYTHGEILD
jgi:hypothetical protein